MSALIEVRGASAIQRALRPWLEPELDAQLEAATRQAAQLYGRELRKALRPVSRRMARAVRVRRARRERPAWVVGSRRKTAFFWPFVIGGTRAHGPRRAKLLYFYGKDGKTHRPAHVRGVHPNPIVERVAARSEGRAMAEADNQLARNT